MSRLRYQLRELLPRLASEANKVTDREIKSRYYLIKAVAASDKPVKRVCEARGISQDTFEKWARRLLGQKTLSALASASRRPKSSPRLTIARVVKKVRRLRRRHPEYGPDRVSFYLKKDDKIVCPPATVYAILKREKLIEQSHRRHRTKAHMKRYRRPWPGYLQMDIKYVPFKVEGLQYYQLSAIDHHSSWRKITICKNKSESTVAAFLDELIRECPFEISQIQTDNGSEFTDKYTSGFGAKPSGSHLVDQWCRNHSIEHRLIPVGEKEINGKVENSHKYDDQEFYSLLSQPMSFEGLRSEASSYNSYWNNERHTKTLGWKTPQQCVDHALMVATAWLLHHKHINDIESIFKEPVLEIKHSPTATIITIKNPQTKTKTKTKKKNLVDRYLQYLDWEERRNIKMIFWAPAMSLSYSRASLSLLHQSSGARTDKRHFPDRL